MIPLSIIIVSFNTKEVTKKCLNKLTANFKRYPINHEIIVVDNGSKDGSPEMLLEKSQKITNLKILYNKTNLGFGRANNLGVTKSKGKFVLFLNSDALVEEIDFNDLLSLMNFDQYIGVLTVKVVLQSGKIDPASHRGFPTLWRSFCYFTGLEKRFAKLSFLNKIFGGYHLVDRNLSEIHEIEVPTGAFLLTRRKIIDAIGGFDKDYFAYGEDIEMAYQIKKLGYKIVYYPLWEVLHLKSVSGLKKKDAVIRKKTNHYFYDSMKIFYRKHYAKKNPWLVNQLVNWTIDFKRYFDNR